VKSLEISFSFPHCPSLPFCCCLVICHVALRDWNTSAYRPVVVNGGKGGLLTHPLVFILFTLILGAVASSPSRGDKLMP
jgi:hypothetical protein